MIEAAQGIRRPVMSNAGRDMATSLGNGCFKTFWIK